jgi:hypothetical protein
VRFSQLEKAIEALEKQRNVLGDAKVGPAIASVQHKLQAVTLAIKRADEIKALKTAIEKLESQRGPLSDDIVDLALKPLKDQLAKVEAEGEEQRAASSAAAERANASSTSSSNSRFGGWFACDCWLMCLVARPLRRHRRAKKRLPPSRAKWCFRFGAFRPSRWFLRPRFRRWTCRRWRELLIRVRVMFLSLVTFLGVY